VQLFSRGLRSCEVACLPLEGVMFG
jgi:hypothetical protein